MIAEAGVIWPSLKERVFFSRLISASFLICTSVKLAIFFWHSFPYHSVDQVRVDETLVQDVSKLEEDSCHTVIVGKIILVSDPIKLCSGNTSQIQLMNLLVKGLRAESARAVTERRCPHSGVGEDYLARQPFFFFYKNGHNSETKSKKLI